MNRLRASERTAPADLDLQVRLLLGCPLCGRRLVLHDDKGQTLLRHGILHMATIGTKMTPLCSNCIPALATSDGYAKIVEAAK